MKRPSPRCFPLVKRLALILVFYSASAALIWAGCKSDCHDAYESEIKSCHEQHDNPEDAADLQTCLQDASDHYNDCISSCKE